MPPSLALPRLKAPMRSITPRFAMWKSKTPLPFAGSAGRTTFRSEEKRTRPSVSRRAWLRSTIPVL